jgi:hypothetical protein
MLNLCDGSLSIYLTPAYLCVYETCDSGVHLSPFVAKDKLFLIHSRHQ